MNKREQRVINAFLNCIKYGEMSADYAVTLIEDNSKYGWLSNEAKETFYNNLPVSEEDTTEESEA